MKNLFLSAAITAAFLTTSAKAETINCTEITTVPTIITAQGVYCLKRDQSSALASGNIIDIQANNVTIDLNGFKLGGLGGGTATQTIGIFAINRQNITIRNGSIRGFLQGISLRGSPGSGHLIEGVLLDGNTSDGIFIQGSGHIVRNNRVVNTGPGGISIEADGIQADNARNTVIAGNVIAGTSESLFADGILVSNSTLIEVRDNTVLDTKDATSTSGIEVFNGTNITAINNRFLNTDGTGIGINDSASASSTGFNCIGNTVAGFATAISGCNFLADNVTPPVGP